MKVQYVGDVNDYRKYALLRLMADAGIKIGINWLLTPEDGRRDGGNRGYLAQPDKWRHYDAGLFDILAEVPPAPTLDDFRKIERKGIIPQAVYYDPIVPAGREAREEFHAVSMEVFQPCDLVFFDPDNGLAARSVSKNQKAAIKFVFDDELADHDQAGRSILVYQHFPRVERTAYIAILGARLRRFAPDAEIWACRTPHVVFMLAICANGSQQTAAKISASIACGQNLWPDEFISFERLATGSW